jgi:hypothetical protein
MEHRCGRRYSVRQPVYLQTPDAVIAAGWLTEVSVSGGAVITHRPMHVDVRLQVRLLANTTNPSPRKFFIAGHVVRQTRHGWALEWSDFSPQLLARLNVHSQAIGADGAVEGMRRRRRKTATAR